MLGVIEVVDRPRNILYLVDYLYGKEGGTERQIFELIMGLDQKRYRPEIAVFQETQFIHEMDLPCKKSVLNVNSMFTPMTILKMLGMAACIHRSKIDLVHIFFNDAAIIAPPFCKIGGARVITSRRDMGFWYTPAILNLLRFSNFFVDRIVANSKAVEDNVSIKEEFPKKRIEVLYNGLNADRVESAAVSGFRKKLGILPTDQILGMVSNLYPVKRPEDLISALSVIHKSRTGVHLVFVGGGPLEIEPLKDFAKKANVNGKVHFLGRIQNVCSIIKHFDVCVLCSESEGLSNAILEYMGCSKPVVCTAVGGNPELIEDGFNGFLVPAGDVDHLSDRIERLLANKFMRDKMGENGRKRFMSEFTGDKMASAYMNLYDKTLNNSETRRTGKAKTFYFQT